MRRFTPALLALLGVFCFSLVNLVCATPVASADASNTINFEARLQTATGGIVPDGSYNIEFKLYSADSGGSALWSEDYLVGAAHGLDTRNGYFSAQLGSRTAFPGTINWNQPLWLTMNIGGNSGSVVASSSSSTGWDGEMDPRLQLTAVPYAFQANKLAQYNNSNGYNSTLGIESATGGNQNFIIQDQGAAGTYNLLTTNQADAGYIKLQGSSPSAQTGYLSITGTGSFGAGIQTAGDISSSGGSIVLQSSTTSSYTTPGGSTTGTKINIQNFTPATGGQIVAFGLTSSADSTAKALTIYDARAGSHTPSIDLMSPNQTQDFGISWDGSNSMPVLKSSTDILGFQVDGYNAATIYSDSSSANLSIGQAGSTNGLLELSNSSNSSKIIIEATGTSSTYRINLPSNVGTAGDCLVVSSVASGTESLAHQSCGGGSTSTLQDAYDNSGSSAVIALNGTTKGIAIQDASTSVGGNLFDVENNAASTSYFSVDTTGAQVTGALTVNGSASINGGGLAIGASSTSRALQATVNDSTVNGPPVLIEQLGAGDASIEFNHGSSSFYIGQDTSNANAFTINSSAAASSGSSINYVQSSNYTNFGSNTSSAVTLGSVGADHLVVAGFSWTHASGDTVTCSDSLGSTFAYYGFNASGTTQYFESCYAITPTGGTDMITVTFGSAVGFRQMVAAEYSGVDTSSPLDVAATADSDPQSSSGTDNAASHSATTTGNGDLIVGLFENIGWGSSSTSAGTGFTRRVAANTDELTLEDLTQPAAGSIAASITISSSGKYYEGAMLAFKPESAGTVTDTFDNSLFSLSQSGAATFKNSADSSHAFQIQDAGGTSMFNTDTASRTITLGPAGGDTVPTLLVLGVKTDSGDPGEIDGAMYYNSSIGTFRCGVASAWVSCIGGLLTSSTQVGSAVTSNASPSAFSSSYTIPANFCASGRIVRVNLYGVFSSTTGTPNVTLRLKLGSTVVATSDVVAVAASQTGKGWSASADIMCPDAAGSSATITTQGTVAMSTSTTTYSIPYDTATVDTTTTQDLTVTGQWSGSGNSITLQTFDVQELGP